MEDAIILADGRYLSSDGKTAHGLVRKSLRYRIVGVIDSELAERDAGEVLDGVRRDIKIYRDLYEALRENPSSQSDHRCGHLGREAPAIIQGNYKGGIGEGS